MASVIRYLGIGVEYLTTLACDKYESVRSGIVICRNVNSRLGPFVNIVSTSEVIDNQLGELAVWNDMRLRLCRILDIIDNNGKRYRYEAYICVFERGQVVGDREKGGGYLLCTVVVFIGMSALDLENLNNLFLKFFNFNTWPLQELRVILELRKLRKHMLELL
ncbi:hypothetical protein Tco_1353514 [Tanacetum coccineum]